MATVVNKDLLIHIGRYVSRDNSIEFKELREALGALKISDTADEGAYKKCLEGALAFTFTGNKILPDAIRFELMLIHLRLASHNDTYSHVHGALELAEEILVSEHEEFLVRERNKQPKQTLRYTAYSPMGAYAFSPPVSDRESFLSQEILQYYAVHKHLTARILALAYDLSRRAGDMLGFLLGSVLDVALCIATVGGWWLVKRALSKEYPWMNTGFTKLFREFVSRAFGLIGFFLALPIACVVFPIKILLPESSSKRIGDFVQGATNPLLQYFVSSVGKSLTTAGGHPVPIPTASQKPRLQCGTDNAQVVQIPDPNTTTTPGRTP